VSSARWIAVAALLLLVAGGCSSDDDADSATPATTSTARSGTSSPTSGPARSQTDPVELAVTDVATGLDTVWALKFDKSGKLWFTQRGGKLSQVDGPSRTIPDVVEQGESGLMGLELDDEGRIYVMLTTADDNRIERFDSFDDATPEVLVSGIRKAPIHDGGRLRFGPDGTLYAGTGDAGDTSLPQQDDSLNGKILAIDVSAKKATVFSKGRRNPQGLCFTSAGRFLQTEHGPDVGDEVNDLKKGDNGGWPGTAGNGIKNWTPTIAPAGCVVYEADAIPQWKGSMLFTTLKDQNLRRLTFAADGSVADEEILYDGVYGRLRDVAVGPDGAVYVATSNRDGRGNARQGDDRIIRIAPKS
jgi:glucose/arabinose dehydrogenase